MWMSAYRLTTASNVEDGKPIWVASAWRNLAVGTSWRAP
jgi:hypothetical protein